VGNPVLLSLDNPVPQLVDNNPVVQFGPVAQPVVEPVDDMAEGMAVRFRG